MHTPRAFRRLTAAALIISLQILVTPVLAQPELPASLTGRVLRAGSDAPLPGARVHAADLTSGKIYTSAPTKSDGTFRLTDLPVSSYEVAVESAGGLYPASARINLEPGKERTIQLTVKQDKDEPKPPAPNRATKPGVWNNPLTATLIILGSAVVLGVVVDNMTKDEASSPSAP